MVDIFTLIVRPESSGPLRPLSYFYCIMRCSTLLLYSTALRVEVESSFCTPFVPLSGGLCSNTPALTLTQLYALYRSSHIREFTEEKTVIETPSYNYDFLTILACVCTAWRCHKILRNIKETTNADN